MKIVFKRVIMSEVLTTYLPTALLIIISYSTTFFGEEFFEANLTVNLSAVCKCDGEAATDLVHQNG